MNKNLIVAAVIIVFIIVGIVLWKSERAGAPVTTEPGGSGDAAVLSQEVESIDTGNLDQEFESIDKDLNSL